MSLSFIILNTLNIENYFKQLPDVQEEIQNRCMKLKEHEAYSYT